MIVSGRIGLGVLAASAVAGALVLAFPRGGASETGEAEAMEPLRLDRLSDSRPSGPGAPAGSLDLLDGVRVSRDAVAGAWGFQDRALLTSASAGGRLELPGAVPDEYDLRIRVTRKQGVGALQLGLVVGGVQGLVTIDGGDSRTSWLSLCGRESPFVNESAVTGKVLKWNKPGTLRIRVRGSRISVATEDRPLIDWEGNPNDLAVDPALRIPHPKGLSIGSVETIFRIDEFVLTPVSGPPSPPRGN